MTSVKHRAEHALRRVRLVPEGRRDRVDLALALLGWLAVLGWLWLAVVPGLSSGKVFLGTDRTNDFAPWSTNYSLVDHGAVNGGILDTIDSATPMALLITNSVRAGHFPLWDPYTSGGLELGALPNSGLLSPMSLAWWVLPAHAANAGVKITEVLVIALGMHLLLRRQWWLPLAAVPLATLTFAASGFMIAWTNWPQTRVAAQLPLLLWAVDRIAVDRRWRNVVPLALVTASMLLGGFPLVVAYGVYTAIPLYLVRSIGARMPWRDVAVGFIRSGAGLVLAVGLAAVQMVPFIEFSRRSVNFDARDGFIGSFLPTQTLATSVSPFLLGYPNGNFYNWPIHYIEGFSYIGGVALVLVGVALLVRPRSSRCFPRGLLPFLVIALAVIVRATYWGGSVEILLQHLPVISTSFFGRIRCIIGLLVALLAAFGLAAVLDAEGVTDQVRDARASWRGALELVLRVAAALVLAWTLLTVVLQAQNASNYQFSRMWTAWALIIIGVTAAAALIVWLGPTLLGSAAVVCIAIILTAYPALSVARNWWPISPTNTFYTQTPTHDFLRANLGQDRYITVGQTLMPGSSTAYQLRSAVGHGFIDLGYQQLLTAAEPQINVTPTYSSLPTGSIASGLPSGILDRLGVKYVVAPYDEAFAYTAEDGGTTTGWSTLAAGVTLSTQSITGPVRGIQLSARNYEGLAEDNGLLEVKVVDDATGEVLTEATSRLSGVPGRGGLVPLAGEDIPEGTTWHAEITLSATASSIDLGTIEGGAVTAGAARAVDDGLKLVHAGDALIFQRLGADERIRWCSSETVITDASERAAAMNAGIDGGTVVLERASDALGLDGSATATVTSKDVTTDEISISVSSTGRGWVVIEDPMRDNGWTATVDGEPAELTDADSASVAVAVPSAGQHTIVLRYTAPGWHVGILLTVACWVGLLAIAGASLAVARRRAHGGGDPARTARRSPALHATGGRAVEASWARTRGTRGPRPSGGASAAYSEGPSGASTGD